MTDNISVSTFSAAAKSVTVKSLLSAVLCLIVYMSVLLLYRGIANPTLAGYTEAIYDKKTKETTYSQHYFEKGEYKIPLGDDTHSYSPIYGKDHFPEIATQLISFVVFSFMIYEVAWGYGSHQANVVSFGRAAKDKLSGIKLGLCGSLVGIAAYLLMLVSKLFSVFDFAMPIFAAVNSAFMPYLNYFLYFSDKPIPLSGLSALTQSETVEISSVGLVAMLLPIALKVLVCFVGYELGFRQISLKDKILYRNKKL